ncbi:MAG: replication initiator protein A [Cellulosilyticaceae bacterium]
MANIITIEEINKDIFYKVPKSFTHNPKYLFMSNEAKLCYGILRDLLPLSIKNGWVNEKNQPFVRVSREKLMIRLQIKGTQKMTKTMKELVDNELIVEKRLGQGNTNIIYVCSPAELNEIIYDDEELLLALTDSEILSEGGKIQTFENQKSKISTIKSLKRLISKNKTVENQSVIENKSIENKLIENKDKNLLLQEDDELTLKIIDHWKCIHRDDINKTTMAILLSMKNRFDEDLIMTLIEDSIGATQNINGYIRSIAADWTKKDIKTFDEYYTMKAGK